MILYGSITSVEITWMLRSALKQGVRRWLRRRVRRSHPVGSRVQRGKSWDGYRSHILNYTELYRYIHTWWLHVVFDIEHRSSSWWHVPSLSLSAKHLSNEVVSSSCWLQDGPLVLHEKKRLKQILRWSAGQVKRVPRRAKTRRQWRSKTWWKQSVDHARPCWGSLKSWGIPSHHHGFHY
jgi:hypothetical protein